ncbi:MAG: glucose/galactose MFS transporter [Bacteroidetes bacterium]|nr:MAG: glucose/galactose MFS transporter [Bacteroidota bacterium]
MQINSDSSNKNVNSSKNNLIPLIFMVSLYFLFGFVTVMNDILIPHLKSLFDLSHAQSMMVQFCFFGAYFLMSLPAGWLLQKIGFQKGIVWSLVLVGIGLLMFIPASMVISYSFFLFALFVIGSGITVLQVAANPYLSLLGSNEGATTRINLAGGFNSLATTFGPIIGGYLIFINADASNLEKAAATRLPYLYLGAFVFILSVVFYFIKLPNVIQEKESQKEGSIWQFPQLKKGALAIFLYVGAEVAIGSLLIGFMSLPENGSLDAVTATKYVSFYWGSSLLGRFGGFLFLSKVSSRTTLLFASILALVCVSVAIVSNGELAVYVIVLLGLCHSVMWPCIFPMSIQGMRAFTGLGSSILIMMVVGGAILPLLQGYLIDSWGYKKSFCIEVLCYLYLLYFAMQNKDK